MFSQAVHPVIDVIGRVYRRAHMLIRIKIGVFDPVPARVDNRRLRHSITVGILQILVNCLIREVGGEISIPVPRLPWRR